MTELFGLTLVSIKDLFANKLRNDAESELAIQIRKCLENGKLVSTDLITELIREHIHGITDGILIIGYPKTKEQMNSLRKLLLQCDFEISRLWVLELNDIDALINERNYKNREEEMKAKFQEALQRNIELSKLIKNRKIVSKIHFDYPMNWDAEEIKTKIKSANKSI